MNFIKWFRSARSTGHTLRWSFNHALIHSSLTYRRYLDRKSGQEYLKGLYFMRYYKLYDIGSHWDKRTQEMIEKYEIEVKK